MTNTDSIDANIAKKSAAEAAVRLIQNGMIVGLGTGSTAAYFIHSLSLRCSQGLKILIIATSEQSEREARAAGLHLHDASSISSLDMTVDGADEIDLQKNMIKGGGGALLREKLLAKSSKEMVVIVDESKLVKQLGTRPLPVEISSFLYLSTLERLTSDGYLATLRRREDNHPYVSDNGNYIVDIKYSHSILDPSEEEKRLKNITGVLATGLFYDIAGRVIVGYKDGNFKIHS